LDRDPSFPPLVSLACHDLRTPLATVHGFAHTLSDRAELPDPAARYVAMIEAASHQLAAIVDRLGLAARIVGGRFEPGARETDTLELARAAAERVGEGRVVAGGRGAGVVVDADGAERGLADLALAALRHGGLERVDLEVEGAEIAIAPVDAAVAPILLGEDLRDLGAAVARLVVDALGGSIRADGGRLRVRLPAA
jgi:signal transduction histidine kinase